MRKTIATFAALATLAATAIAPAHAGWFNGVELNGLSLNGGGENGTFTNGGGSNGGGNNGTFTNGGGDNGAADGSSTLTIQAIELPPETR
jgi:hypothetical protein